MPGTDEHRTITMHFLLNVSLTGLSLRRISRSTKKILGQSSISCAKGSDNSKSTRLQESGTSAPDDHIDEHVLHPFTYMRKAR